jgi:hypothetical protein
MGLGLRRVWLAGGAFAGLVVAHCLSYVAVAPEQHHRQDLLHSTGHGDWNNVWLLAGALFVAALIGFGGRWAAPNDRAVPLRNLYRYAWIRLVPAQVIGFMLLEGLERSSSDGSLADMWSEPVVLWGIVLQVVIALAGGFLLVGFTHLVRALRKASEPAHGRVPLQVPCSSAVLVPPSAASRAWNSRGPPTLLRSS